MRYYREASELTDALRFGLGEQAALGTYARPGEANWSEVACFGYAYGRAPAQLRVEIQRAIRAGLLGGRLVPPPVIEGAACPREVAYEPLYQPQPACYPVEARLPVALGLASVVAGGLLTLILIKVGEQIRGRD